MKNERIQKLVLTGVFAALSYAIFTFLQFKIPLPGGDATSIHLGNAVCVLAALILGGFYGGLAGAIGMTIGDLLEPIYVVYAPKTFLLKLCIGLIVGLIAHRLGRITHKTDRKNICRWVLLAALGGLRPGAVPVHLRLLGQCCQERRPQRGGPAPVGALHRRLPRPHGAGRDRGDDAVNRP